MLSRAGSKIEPTMNKHERIIPNALSSILQVAISGVTLFLLYRFLLNTIGVEKVGVWALIMATASLGQISNLGLTDSAVKFVAKYGAREEQETVSRLIQTILISVGTSLGLMLLIFYLFSEKVLTLVIDAAVLPDALGILPMALASSWLMTIGGICLGGIDGYHRIDLRNFITIGYNLIYVFLSWLLVNEYGLPGLAWAQFSGSVLLLAVSYYTLSRFTSLPPVPLIWDKALFREMLGYGISFQVISIAKLLYEPITKGLISIFGGLAMVGYYEMASRMVQQFRGLIVAANQVLIPTFADLTEREAAKIVKVYTESLQAAIFVAIPIFSLVASFIPLISLLWLGNYEETFVGISLLLLAGWFINILAAPAYFAYVGIGRLRWNVVGSLITALLTITLGWYLGAVGGGMGVVAGFVIALAGGSVISPIAYHIEEKLSGLVFINFYNRLIIAAGMLNVVICYYIFYKTYSLNNITNQAVISLTAFAILMLVPIIKHPMRLRLQRWLMQFLLKTSTKEGGFF